MPLDICLHGAGFGFFFMFCCALRRGIEGEHPELCSNIIFICGMSARGRTEFYQPIVEHLSSIVDEGDPANKLLT